MRSGARAASHARCDKRHLGAVVEHVANVVDGFLGSFSCALRFVAGAQSFLAELQVYRHGRVVERLVVGVAEHKTYIVYAFAVHVVYGIAASATYTDDLDDAVLFFGFAEIQYCMIIVVFHIAVSFDGGFTLLLPLLSC